MTEVHFTGQPRVTKKPEKVCCYLCTRTERGGTLTVLNGKGHVKRLALLRVSFRNSRAVYQVILCEECVLLLGAFSSPTDSKLTVE